MEDHAQSLDVSIVIPVYNDPDGIKQTLQSITKHNTPTLTEVRVVDNASTDNTKEVVRNHKPANSVVLSREVEIQSSYAARNKGIKETNEDHTVVAFLDSDETVGDDWLEKALVEMQTRDIDYLGCNVEITLPEDTLVGRYNARAGFPVEQYLEDQNYAPTCALLVRRKVFEDVGPFDARLISGGDREFGDRVHDAGYEQGYAENATVYHPARTSLESLAKKNFRVGRGFCQKQRYYPERYGKPGIPPTPSGPSGGDDGDEPDASLTRLAFALLSIAMLACRGVGYYYEFVVGEENDDIPAPTS
ncbi:glycosyltransferase [Halobacterium salinarum]|uniref:glycosyltransferase n=1 Tax=Halobacterium TaxID=2239 RepID=UPI001F36F3E9|nr:glycosyltransferase [Halobacterium salinarum]MCF2165518.1 glycosyltransferase [Halobacterium salinarum]MCF2168687.1 glycosyltransferase [Halobacterium salinarum]MDL0124880.1 glycosyltransferase [Halobacterium salinarum]MDL0138301.1 glycosyltransferase [Halobacterium salinarum]